MGVPIDSSRIYSAKKAMSFSTFLAFLFLLLCSQITGCDVCPRDPWLILNSQRLVAVRKQTYMGTKRAPTDGTLVVPITSRADGATCN
jgi:hypothetical protein